MGIGKRKVSVHLALSYEDAEEFNRNFWLKAGAQARFAAAWQIILDYHKKIRGKRGRLPRLRRSIQIIQR